MAKIVEYNYSEDLFNDHSSKIKYIRLRGISQYNELGVLGSGLTIYNLYISSDINLTKPLITVSNNSVTRKWSRAGKYNTDNTDSQYDIVVVGMMVEEEEQEVYPIDAPTLALFEDDYSDPPKIKDYERLIIHGRTGAEVQVKYESYKKDYTGTYKITGIRSDQLGVIRSWSTTGVANPADVNPPDETDKKDIGVIVEVPVRLKKSSDNTDYPLASVQP